MAGVRWAPAAAAATLLLTACTSSPTSAPAPPVPTVTASYPPEIAVAVSTVRPDIVPLAGISGVLAVTAEGCFGLRHTGDAQLVVFPIGTVVTADGRGLDIPGLGDVILGDWIEWGGGVFDFSRDYPSIELPEQCTGD